MLKPATALAVSLVLVHAAAALAAQPFTLDAGGENPHVAVAEDGTGHVVWDSAGSTAIGYCQVPRGGTACTKTQRFTGVSGVGIEGPRVLLHRDGRIVIVAERVCDRVAFVSSDGGATFTEPKPIASGCVGTELGFRAEFGPGEDSVSYLAGGLFKAAPLGGPASTGHARLGPAYASGLAFVDPLTPIVALSDLKQISFRRFDGTGDHNDPANWTPAAVVGPGENPDLAGGVRGVYLSYEVASGQLIRRFDAATGTFGPPQNISGAETNFGDLHQSASGSLHQTWTRTGFSPLEHRRSLDGVGWLATETLADDDRGRRHFYDQHVATAGDGGGFAVWDDTIDGDVRAVEIAPNSSVSQPPGVCRVQIGIAVAIAREGCFQREGSRYTAPGEVRVNGIDLSGAGKVTIDVGQRSLKTSAPVTAKVGNVALGTGQLDWRIPQAAGAITDSAGNDVTFDAAKANAEVLALLVSGWTTPRIIAGEAVELPVNVELPAPLSTLLSDKATGSLTLRASNQRSLELASAAVDVKGVSIGIAEIERFNLVYRNLDPWILQGKTSILLPVVGTKVETEFGVKGGDFDYARGNVLFDPPRPLATLVQLKQIRFDTNNRDGCKTPAKIAGGVTLTLISEHISRIEGDAFYKFPLASCKQPGVFRIDGKGYLRDLQVADMYAQYVTPKHVTFGGGADVNTGAISAGFRVDGAIDVPSKTYFAEGKVSAGHISDAGAADDPKTPANETRPPQREEIVGASVIVSSIGMRACTEVAGGKFNAGFGFHQRWGKDSAPVPDWPFFEGCEGEASEFRPAGFGSRATARASQARRGFQVARGVPFVNLRIEGPGGPQVVVRGPGGRAVTTRAGVPELTARHAFAVRTAENRTFVRIFAPRRGRWTVTAQAGSTITRVLHADGLPKPSVRVRLTRAAGGRRVLSWRLRRLPGQRVRFFERGAGGIRALRTVSSPRGALRFTPASGLERRRQVVAVVESGGLARATLVVARFTAPGDSLPSRPRQVTLTRGTGNTLVIRWSHSRAASSYAVNLALRDGRRVTHVTRARRLVVGAVPGIDGGTVSVAGLRADNRTGPARTATLTPAPKVLLRAAARQRLGRLTVDAGCGAQACRVRARGTVTVSGTARRFALRSASVQVPALQRRTLRLRAASGAARALARLLTRGRRATATVTVGLAGARVRVRLRP